MSRLLVHLLLLAILGSVWGNRPQEDVARNYLKTVAMNRIDPLSRPVQDPADILAVQVGLKLTKVTVSGANVTMSGWLALQWLDYQLSWVDKDPESRGHPGDVLKVRTDKEVKFWTPNVVPIDMVPAVNAEWISWSEAGISVYNNGTVQLVAPVAFSVDYDPAIGSYNWVTCPVRFGSWTYSKRELELLPLAAVVDTTVVHYVRREGDRPMHVESSSVKAESAPGMFGAEQMSVLAMELKLEQTRRG